MFTGGQMRILVTGGVGFIGSNFIHYLVGLNLKNIEIVVLDKLTYAANLRNLDGLDENSYELIIGDICDGNKLTNSMQQATPDIVIHLAAQPIVRRSYIEPVETYATNVMGTVNLLEAVRQTSSVRAVVNVTTDKCYENKEWLWGYRESDPLGGFDPYSSSKGCSELVTAAYRNSFFNRAKYSEHLVAIASARAGNVIGGGDWAEDRLIPDIFRALKSGQSVIIRNPYATRPWQHVLEPLSGYLALSEKLYTQGAAFAEAFNFGPAEDDAKPVQWVVEQIANQWGADASWHLDTKIHPHEAHYLKLDCSKARAELGWVPRWHLRQALQATTDWNKAYICNYDMKKFSLKQIEKYSDNLSTNPHS